MTIIFIDLPISQLQTQQSLSCVTVMLI